MDVNSTPPGLPLRERIRILRGRLWWQVVRLIQRLLVGSRGEVTALEQAIHLQERLVILAMVVASVVPALLLLVYFAFTAADPVSFEAEQKNQALQLGGRLETAVETDLGGFQKRVLDRLAAGGSVLERLDPLHPQLLIAWQIDESGRPVAPFGVAEASQAGDPGLLVEGPFAEARAHARISPSDEATLSLFGPVAAHASARLARQLATLEVARALGRTGKIEDALAALDALAANDEGARDPWGFRVRDLARLDAVRLRLEVDPVAGTFAARALIEALLTEPWFIGQGGDAAVARAALRLLPTGERAPSWVADASSRLASRAELLYWSDALLSEWERVLTVLPGSLREDSQTLRWALDKRALWGAMSARGSRYVFALDRESLRQIFSDRARGALGEDQPIVARFSMPGEKESEAPEEPLARVSLDPWLPGCAFVVMPSSHYAEQLAARARQDLLRKAVVVVSLATLLLGVFFTIRLVIRELDLAQMKTRFAANVSHELRSPLTQIRLKGEALMLGLADTPEEQQAYYRAIVRESERLGRLVDDVLDYAVLPSGRHNLAPRIRTGSLVDTVHRALDSIHASEELRTMDLDVDLPTDLPLVAHDPDAVVRCVINLVSNAAKYGKESKWIGVRARQVDGGVEVAISDRGIGILPSDVDRIFDPYFRSSDPRVGNKKGAGLGLTMTAEIMKAHGGKVLVTSRLGKGSTFTLRFPLHASPGILSPVSR